MADLLFAASGATIANASATIDWGDGTASAIGSSSFTVAGRFPSLTPQGLSFTVNEHQPFIGEAVATFTDSDTGDVPTDFTATIDWGDGETTAGSVNGGNGMFTVLGGHTYATPGEDTLSVTLTDNAGLSPVSATATSTAVVSETPPFDIYGDGVSDLVFQNEGSNPDNTPGALLVYRWNGSVEISGATYPQVDLSWHVVASRDVNGDGLADLIWQNSDGRPGVWLMNGGPIAEVGLANPGPFWHLVAAGDIDGDGNADFIWQGADGTLGVWLMNGATPLAEVGLANPGANWKVVGAADYNGDGKDDILLQDKNSGNLMIDLMNGPTIASTVSITVGDPSWHAVSTGVFNGRAEIAWQNGDGHLGIWSMNGTAPAAEVGLGDPGAGWQLVSIDHFTPRQGDLLLQNSSSGATVIWNMNGTAVAGMVGVPNPGLGWQSENGHPFAQA